MSETHPGFTLEQPHKGRSAHVKHCGGIFDGEVFRQIVAEPLAHLRQLGVLRRRQIEWLRWLEGKFHQKQPDNGVRPVPASGVLGKVGEFQDQFPKERCDRHDKAFVGEPLHFAAVNQKRPELHARMTRRFVLQLGRKPDGPAWRDDPGALLRLDRYDPADCIEKLSLFVTVLRSRKAVSVMRDDGDLVRDAYAVLQS